MFSPRRDQPANVLDQVGSNGEHLAGPDVEPGSVQVIRTSLEVAIPYRP
jgi:hypothetical protein